MPERFYGCQHHIIRNPGIGGRRVKNVPVTSQGYRQPRLRERRFRFLTEAPRSFKWGGQFLGTASLQADESQRGRLRIRRQVETQDIRIAAIPSAITAPAAKDQRFGIKNPLLD